MRGKSRGDSTRQGKVADPADASGPHGPGSEPGYNPGKGKKEDGSEETPGTASQG
jgi:hypothetical protein